MGFFKNYIAGKVFLILMTTELQPVSYSIEIPGIEYYYTGTIDVNNEDIVDLPRSVEVLSHDDTVKKAQNNKVYNSLIMLVLE